MTLDNGGINSGKYSFWKKVAIFVGLLIFQSTSSMAIGIFYLGKEKLKNPNGILVGAFIILALIIYILISIFIGKKLKILSFDLKWITGKNIAIILGGTVGAILVMKILSISLLKFGFLFETSKEMIDFEEYIGSFNTVINILIVLLHTVILAPIIEELLFRGFIMNIALKDKKYLSIIVSSVIFGILHYPNSKFSSINTLLIGFILAISYYKTSRIEVPIMIHMLYNFSITILEVGGLQ